MLTLLIDLGNTRSKLRWIYSDDDNASAIESQPEALTSAATQLLPHIPCSAEMSLPVTATEPEVRDALSTFLQRHACAPFRVHGVQVGPIEHASSLEQVIQSHPQCQGFDWHRARAEALGLRNAYRDPSSLGPDRWMAALGIWAQLGQQAAGHLIAMCGTALTVDAIDTQQKLWLGGIIAPGLDLMLKSLHLGTARLPLSQGQWQQHPNNTHDAIRTGCLDAQAGVVLARYLELRERIAGPLVLHFGGGAASLVMERCKILLAQATAARQPPRVMHHDNPVLLGLEAIAYQSPKATRQVSS